MTPRILTPEEVAEIVALRKRRSLPADLAESFDRLLHTLRQREAEIGRLLQHHGGHTPDCSGLDEVERRCACGYLQGEAYRDLVEENARLRAVAEAALKARPFLPDPDATRRQYAAAVDAAMTLDEALAPVATSPALAPRGEGKDGL